LVLMGGGTLPFRWKVSAAEPPLTAAPVLDAGDLGALAVVGMMTHVADPAIFVECHSARSYPVAMEGGDPDLERACLANRPAPGAAVAFEAQAPLDASAKARAPGQQEDDSRTPAQVAPDIGRKAADHGDPEASYRRGLGQVCTTAPVPAAGNRARISGTIAGRSPRHGGRRQGTAGESGSEGRDRSDGGPFGPLTLGSRQTRAFALKLADADQVLGPACAQKGSSDALRDQRHFPLGKGG
jgi:hypothetical protein